MKKIKREGQFAWTRAFEFIELLYGMVAGFTVLNFGHYSGNKKCCQRLNFSAKLSKVQHKPGLCLKVSAKTGKICQRVSAPWAFGR